VEPEMRIREALGAAFAMLSRIKTALDELTDRDMDRDIRVFM
jgi:hypothetical protein